MASNEDEVEDYMSDTFVAQEVNDVRPSLLYSHQQKVKHQSMKKKSLLDPKPKSYYNELEKQLREEALNKPLDETNKGFKMLAKMGFKGFPNSEAIDLSSGQTLTDDNKPSVSVEPIRIEVKNDRKGFGTIVPKRPKIEHKIDPKLTEENFLSHKRSKNQMILMERDLRTAQKVCRNLDLESGLDEKTFLLQTLRPKWFWPPIEKQSTEDEEEDNEEDEETEEEKSIDVMFKAVNDYLRDKYFYCIWCGIRFNDNQDLSDNCLGDNRDDHQ